MTLAKGTRLGPYAIEGPLGAGGMGEVYRARDTRLDRTVAIKVLPQHLSSSPDLRARFEREARAASSLSHPNICTLHDIGSQDDTDFLVMEYLDGETLADRLERGPMPLPELLKVGTQLADALDRAHRSGLVHRDLKPGNVMLTRSGAKLMDFGLAKTTEALAASSLTAAPTATSPLTAEGSLIGTIQYMSPEQLEGREADSRSDLFALGAVLFEMATGRRMFHGPSQASVIAAILREEPRQGAVEVSPALDRLVRACVEKDPEERLQSAHDIKIQLQWIATAGEPGTVAALDGPPARSRLPRWVLAALALVAAAGWSVALWSLRSAPPTPQEVRFIVPPPPDTRIVGSTDVQYAPSPDGTRLAIVAEGDDGVSRIVLRDLDSLRFTEVSGTEGAVNPFWSPDGRNLAFAVLNTLKRVSVDGGTPQTLAQAGGSISSGDWSANGTILIQVANHPILAVPESGGALREVTRLDTDAGEVGHLSPSFLPDGRRFLFLNLTRDAEERSIQVGSLEGDAPITLLKSRFPGVYLSPGYLLHVQGASLMAQRLRLDPPEVVGSPALVAESVGTASVPGYAAFTASDSGLIAYRPPTDRKTETRLGWFDRDGNRIDPAVDIAQDITLSLSPDLRNVVVDRVTGTDADSAGGNPPTNLWVLDLARNVGTRLTTDPSRSDENPIWSPDGKWIAYASHDRGADAVLLVRPALGTGTPREIPVPGRNPHPHDWSPDGTRILVHVSGPDGHLDLQVVPVSGEGEVVTVGTEGFDDCQGTFSPDGRWLAYTSNLSGAKEVYIRSFPEEDQQWQVSSAGGVAPRWRADGKELYYLAPDDTLMSVGVETTPELQVTAARPLFEVRMFGANFYLYGGGASYAPAPDGQRFLIDELLSRGGWGPLQVILNWTPPSS